MQPSSFSPRHDQHFSSVNPPLLDILVVPFSSIPSLLHYHLCFTLSKFGPRQGPAVGRRLDSLIPVVCEITFGSLVSITWDSTYEKPGGAPVLLVVSPEPLIHPGISSLRGLPRLHLNDQSRGSSRCPEANNGYYDGSSTPSPQCH